MSLAHEGVATENFEFIDFLTKRGTDFPEVPAIYAGADTAGRALRHPPLALDGRRSHARTMADSLRVWREVHGQSCVKLFGSYLSVHQAMHRGNCAPVRSVPAAMNRGRADADAAKLKVLVIATQ